MSMVIALLKLGSVTRDIYLYDTFAGMSAPTDADVTVTGATAKETYNRSKIANDVSEWCLAPLDEVQKNVFGTGYPKERFHFIKGKVEETIPMTIPKKIALLRLDTDWYESTRHELIHLFPLLEVNGVLIIDDYGHWEGAKKAVDEYIKEKKIRILLNRIDYTGRLGIKT